jgi:predicted MFS family arabinose efflux permease
MASFIVSLTQMGYALGLFFLVPLGDLLENRRLMIITTVVAAPVCWRRRLPISRTCFLLMSLLVGFSSVSVQILDSTGRASGPGTVTRSVSSAVSWAVLLLGILLARPLSSLVADHFGWRAMFMIRSGDGGDHRGTGLDRASASVPDHSASYGQLLGSLWTLMRQHAVLRQRAFYQGCMFAAFSLFWTAVPVELARNHGLSQSQIALFALVGAIGAIAAPIAVAWPTPVTRNAIAAGTGSCPCSVPARLHSPGLQRHRPGDYRRAAGFRVQMSMVLGQRAIYALDAASRGRFNALYMTSIFIGGAIGSSVASAVYEHGGWLWIVIVGSVFPLLALLRFLSASQRGSLATA